MPTLAGMPFPDVLMALEAIVGSNLMVSPPQVGKPAIETGIDGAQVSARATPTPSHRCSRMPPPMQIEG